MPPCSRPAAHTRNNDTELMKERTSMLPFLHLFCKAKGAQAIFSIAVEMMLRVGCDVFVVALEVF